MNPKIQLNNKMLSYNNSGLKCVQDTCGPGSIPLLLSTCCICTLLIKLANISWELPSISKYGYGLKKT